MAAILAVISQEVGVDGWESNPPRTPQQRPADGFEDRGEHQLPYIPSAGARLARADKLPAQALHLDRGGAAPDMVVYKSHGLHKGVHRRRADKSPSSPAQVLAHRDRLLGRADFHQRGMVEQAPAWLWLEAPYVGGEAAELIHQIGVAAGVVDRRVDLRPVADDARVSHQSGRVAGAEAGDRLGLESAKRGAKVLPLAQDGHPAEPRHEAFEAELLEQPPIVKHRPAPLGVVISAVEGGRIAPPTPSHAHRAAAQSRR